MVITFSGLDGSGKSTQIELLAGKLRASGRDVTVKTMYFDLTFYSFLRRLSNFFFSEASAHRDTLSLQSRGITASPKRIFKNLYVKRFFYIFDYLVLTSYIFLHSLSSKILILDRCLIDETIDILSPGSLVTPEFLPRFIQTGSLTVFLYITPEESFLRKGEYSIDYLAWRLRHYSSFLDHLSNRNPKRCLIINTEDSSVQSTFDEIFHSVERIY